MKYFLPVLSVLVGFAASAQTSTTVSDAGGSVSVQAQDPSPVTASLQTQQHDNNPALACTFPLPNGMIIGTLNVQVGCNRSESSDRYQSWVFAIRRAQSETTESTTIDASTSPEGIQIAADNLCAQFNIQNGAAARDGTAICDISQMRLVYDFRSSMSRQHTRGTRAYSHSVESCMTMNIPVYAPISRAGFNRRVCQSVINQHNTAYRAGNEGRRQACLKVISERGCLGGEEARPSAPVTVFSE